MFKSLDLIESFGSGIGKAKRAMAENGQEKIHFEEYSDNIDITSVVVPINSKYLEFISKAKKTDNESLNLDIESQNLDIESQKIDIRVNSIDSIGIIKKSNYSNTIKNALMRIYHKFFNETFGRSDIVNYLTISNASGTNYINYLIELELITPVTGLGKGKYKFR